MLSDKFSSTNRQMAVLLAMLRNFSEGEPTCLTVTHLDSLVPARRGAVSAVSQSGQSGLHLVLDQCGTLYDQIARAIRSAILEGRIVAGYRLPSTRTFAAALGVSRKSVLQAYELLCAEGLAVARGGSGTRVADLTPAAKSSSGISVVRASRYTTRLRELPAVSLAGALRGGRLKYDLRNGEPLVEPALFHSWRRKLAAAALRAGSTYPRAEGHLPLCRAIAGYLGRYRGIICEPSDVLVVGGTQQALTIIERVLLDPGDQVVIEDPHYELALYSLLAHGAHVTHVRTDHDGLIVSDLPQQATRLTLVTPSHQFPSGVVMTTIRRLELLEWAARTDSWIVEDDYNSEFPSGEQVLPALRSLDLADRVLYVGSFSKSLFPALRLGYIVCPKSIRHDLYRAKWMDDLGSSVVEQAALAAFIQNGQYANYLNKSVKEIANRRRAVVEALKSLPDAHIEIGAHQGGTNLLVWFCNLGFDQFSRLIERAESLGLGLEPVDRYYHTRPSRPGLLIGYGGLSVGQLRYAIELLGRCLSHEQSAGKASSARA
jgi:GntR family transcriptional regulator/MocR family aminotransferase